MSGVLKIDGTDVWTVYGVYFLEGSYKGVLQYPALKQPEINDWHEANGIEVDLSAPVLDAKELTLRFLSKNNAGKVNFLALITTGSVHVFEFTELGVTLSLRVTTQGNHSITEATSIFEITFSEDQPMVGYTYVAPESNNPDEGYAIDTLNIAKYGMVFLNGTMAAISKPPSPKQNLLINRIGAKGIVYDGETVVYQSKEIAIPCLMRSGTIQQFIVNYEALLYDLIRAGERELHVSSTNQVLPFYYKSSTVEEINLTAGGWCLFTISIVITKP